MALTKIDMLKAIKTIVENSGDSNTADYLKTLDTTIESIENKYANAKLKKQTKLDSEYKALKKEFLNYFENNPNLLRTNSDITMNISTSKKTQIAKRLIDDGVLKKIAPSGKVKVVQYQLVNKLEV